MTSIWSKHIIGITGLILLILGAVVVPVVLAILLVDNTPPVIGVMQPGGTVSSPTILPVGQSYSFVSLVGDDQPLNSGTSNCGSTPKVCISMTATYGPSTTSISNALFGYSWAGGVATSSPVCTVSGGCAPSFASTSAACGAASCYWTIVTLTLPTSLKGNYVSLQTQVWDVAGNIVTATNYGFIDQPYGFMILTTAGTTYKFCPSVGPLPTGCTGTSATVVTSSLSQSFQFNATSLASSITNVAISVVATNPSTNTGTGSYCLVGSTGCSNAVYTGTSPNYLFPTATAIGLGNGIYNVTGTFSCTGCSLPSYRVLSLIGTFGTSPLILPIFSTTTLIAIVGAVMLVSDLGWSVVKREHS